MYPYCKNAPLYDLKATGSGNELIFETPTEKAITILSAQGTIDRVIHFDKVNGTERVIDSGSSHDIVVGESNWRRNVFHFLKPSSVSHLQLRLGLTVHDGLGTWSSLPHDFENQPEKDFEEVFFYILKGGNKKSYQVGRGLWADGSSVDEIWPVEDRTFSVIPMGHHPVVGEPKVNVSYVWAYLAKKKEWEKI